MPQAETGSLFATVCPICNYELQVGWDRPGEEASEFKMKSDSIKVKPQKDKDDIVTGPVTCSCGNVTIEFSAKLGRAIITWVTTRPPIGNINLH